MRKSAYIRNLNVMCVSLWLLGWDFTFFPSWVEKKKRKSFFLNEVSWINWKIVTKLITSLFFWTRKQLPDLLKVRLAEKYLHTVTSVRFWLQDFYLSWSIFSVVLLLSLTSRILEYFSTFWACHMFNSRLCSSVNISFYRISVIFMRHTLSCNSLHFPF